MLRTLAGSSVAILSSLWLNVQVLGLTSSATACLFDLGHGTLSVSQSPPSVTWFIQGLKTLKRVRYSAWVKGWKIRLLLLLLFQAKSNKFDGISCFRFVVAAGAKGAGLGLNKRGNGVTLAPASPCPLSWVLFLHPHSSSEYSLEILSTSDREGAEDQGPSWPHPTP